MHGSRGLGILELSHIRKKENEMKITVTLNIRGVFKLLIFWNKHKPENESMILKPKKKWKANIEILKLDWKQKKKKKKTKQNKTKQNFLPIA